jgi:hypothetical protein
VFDLRAKQQLNRGYSDGLARGFEIMVTPLIFGAIGWLLDSWIGTGPFLAIALGTFGVVGIFAKLKLGYDREIAGVEAGKPWARGAENLPAEAPE